MGAWIGFGLIIFVAVIITSNAINERNAQKIKREEERTRAVKERQKLEEKYNGKHISFFVDIPKGTEIGWDNLPREIGSKIYWGEKYTFYVTYGGRCYHAKNCRYAQYSIGENAYTVKHRYSPCGYCAPVLPPLDWVKKYRELEELAKKNNLNIDFSLEPENLPPYVAYADRSLLPKTFIDRLDFENVKAAIEEKFIIDVGSEERGRLFYRRDAVISEHDETKYNTDLQGCTCYSSLAYHCVCKHMIALAIYKGALKIDPTKLFCQHEEIESDKAREQDEEHAEVDQIDEEQLREHYEETQEMLKPKDELEGALLEENRRLRDEIVQAKNENKRLCDEITQEKAQNKQLTDKVGRLKSENDKLLLKIASRSQLQSEIENRFGEFKNLSNVRERLREETDCIKAEIEKLFSEKLFLIHQRNEAEDSFKEVESLSEKGDFLREEIERIKSNNDALCKDLRYWNGEAERVHEAASKNLPKAFIGQELFQQYMESMSTTRLDRALSEEMRFNIPFELSAVVDSSSGETYTTTLTKCTCEDFKRHARPCKHMIGLAVRVKALAPYQKEMEDLLRTTGENLMKASEKEASAKEIRRKNGETKAELNEIKKFIEEKQQSYPWLAKLISSYKLAKMDIHIKDIHTKRELSSKIRRVERERALLANQLAVYEYMFPILNSFKELPPESITVNLFEAKSTGFHYNWLSDDEYKVLTNAEKQQLWIKNYFSRRSKNAWEAGIKYERYIGYLCEKEGFSVKYTGALLKLNDMGRDLIATKGNTIYIIQCKRFSEKKEIHENHLFQLFGSTCHYQTEHPSKNIVGVFVTTSHLSDVARVCAEKLGILLFENAEFKEYPVIKCNIGKDGEKIYHLPFDQQYDNVTIKIDSEEMYVSTIEEAERRGFRHAMKHKFIA